MSRSVPAGAPNVLLLVTLASAVFVASAGTHALTPLFPEVKSTLSVGDAAARALTSVFTLGYALSSLVLGVACDRLGRRRVLLLSLSAYAAMNFLLLVPLGYAPFLAVRALAGLATGGIVSAAVALTADAVPYARRGRALAIVLAGGYVALVLGIPVAAELARWRLTAFFGLLGVVAAATALAALRIGSHAPAGAAGGLLASPVAALKSSGTRAVLFGTFAFTASSFAVMTSFSDACLDRFGADLDRRGGFFLWLGLGALPGAVLAGLFSDRLGKRRAVVIALVGALATTPLLLLARTFGQFLGVAMLVSMIVALRQGPLFAILTALVPPSLRGSLVGLNSAASGLGIACGTWLGGLWYGGHGLDGVVWGAILLLGAGAGVFLARVSEPGIELEAGVVPGREEESKEAVP